MQLETIRPEVAGRIPAARIAAAPRGASRSAASSECALLYTSGTTGRPKGCRLSNGYFLRAGEWYLGLGELAELRADAERIITPLPLSHMNALAFSSMAAILSGGCIVQLDRFHPPTWWQSVRESGATVVHYLGVMPAMLLAAPPSAAGPPPHGPLRLRRRRRSAPPRRVRGALRLSAARGLGDDRDRRGGLHHGAPRAAPRRHALLRPRRGLRRDARRRPSTAPTSAVDVPGELLVRAAGAEPRHDFFLGYLKDDEATEEAWAGGWFHTGDVVRRSADGDFHFVDRRKNVIRRSGENISAVEVESVLDSHPAVAAERGRADARPDARRRGARLHRAAQGARRCRRTTASRPASCAMRWSGSPTSRRRATSPSSMRLPLTASQKIQRGELRELARTLPGKPNCIDTRS